MAKGEKTIKVRGPIGKFRVMENGQPVLINGMQLVDLVTQITTLPEDTKTLIVEVGSLGGSVPVAKGMRDVLKSYGGRMKVITRQVDDIASAGTIIFSAGKERIAAKGINPSTGEKFKMMVHNTWLPNTSGNADQLQDQADSLRMSDQEFVDIYTEDTGVTAEAIAPLMKAETFFDADQAIALKFATGTYEAGLQQAAYHNKTNQAMTKVKKQNKVVAALLTALGIQTGEEVAAAPPAELMGKPVMIAGAAAVDGVYTVVGGVVTKLSGIEEEDPAPAAGAPGAAAGAAPAAALTEDRVKALIAAATKQGKKKSVAPAPDDEDEDEEDEDKDSIEKLAAAIGTAVVAAQTKMLAGKRSGGAPGGARQFPIGFKPENKEADAKEWDRSFKAGEHVAMRRDDREKWERLFFAKYGRLPN